MTTVQIEGALLCQGAGRNREGQIIHALGCPVVLREGDRKHASHGLSDACLPLYIQWCRSGAL